MHRLFVLLCFFSSSAFALTTKNFDSGYFENCAPIDRIIAREYEKEINKSDEEVKEAFRNVSSETASINAAFEKLSSSFDDVKKTVNGKDLKRIKDELLNKQDVTAKHNEELLQFVAKIKQKLEQELARFGKSYCQIVSYGDYFNSELEANPPEPRKKTLITSRDEMNDKQVKFDKLIEDLDHFWGLLINYLSVLEESSKFLNQFVINAISHENNTCNEVKIKGACKLPDDELLTLPEMKEDVIEANAEFLESKILVGEKSIHAYTSDREI